MGKTATQLAAEFIQGTPDGWYAFPTDVIPKESYRAAVISYDPAVGSLSPEDMLQVAKAAGWRVLKATYIEELVPAMEGLDSFLAYVRPEVMPMPLGTLTGALEARAVVVAKGTVDEAEKLALDALWMAEGTKVPDSKVGVDIPIVGIVIGGLALLLAGRLLFGRK